MINNLKGGITSSIGIMVVIMLSINIGLSLTQEGVTSITGEHNNYIGSNNPLNNYASGSLSDSNTDITINSDYLPSDEETTDSTGNLITDTYDKAKSWFKDKLSGLSFISNMFQQPRLFLQQIGIPVAIANGVQVLWSLIFILLVTAFIMGRT